MDECVGLCAGTGYRGRIAVIEMLPVDEDVRRTISEGTSLEALRRHVFESLGMRTIRESALLKAVEGQTSIEKVIRVTGTKAE